MRCGRRLEEKCLLVVGRAESELARVSYRSSLDLPRNVLLCSSLPLLRICWARKLVSGLQLGTPARRLPNSYCLFLYLSTR